MAYEDLYQSIAQQGQQMGMMSQAPVHPIARAINSFAQARMFGQAMQSQKVAEEQVRRQHEEQIKASQTQRTLAEEQRKGAEQRRMFDAQAMNLTVGELLAPLIEAGKVDKDIFSPETMAKTVSEMGGQVLIEAIVPLLVRQVDDEHGTDMYFQSIMRFNTALDSGLITDEASAIHAAEELGGAITKEQAVLSFNIKARDPVKFLETTMMAAQMQDAMRPQLKALVVQLHQDRKALAAAKTDEEKKKIQASIDETSDILMSLRASLTGSEGSPGYVMNSIIADMFFSEVAITEWEHMQAYIKDLKLTPYEQMMQDLTIAAAMRAGRGGGGGGGPKELSFAQIMQTIKDGVTRGDEGMYAFGNDALKNYYKDRGWDVSGWNTPTLLQARTSQAHIYGRELGGTPPGHPTYTTLGLPPLGLPGI